MRVFIVIILLWISIGSLWTGKLDDPVDKPKIENPKSPIYGIYFRR